MTSPLILRDNSSKKLDADEYDAYIEELTFLSEHTIQELTESGELLVFPHSFNKLHGINDEDLTLFQLRDGGRELVTGNLMGFIGYRNLQVSILSRFAPSSETDTFLQYMLMKTGGINIFQLEHTASEDQVFDFLLFLFPMMLKKALSQGIFREYQSRQYNDANLRGPIDVSRHISKNTPFSGAVAYNTREYSCDNRITQLIRHTIEYIRCGNYRFILENDRDTKEYVSQILLATPKYNLKMRPAVISKNIRPVNHPWFSHYTDLQKLCLQILMYEQFKYGLRSNNVYGVLFDGAWLWEEYVNTILAGCGFIHPKNKEGFGGKNLLSSDSSHKWRCYPDFYRKKSAEGPAIVLDAKYKRMLRRNEEQIGKIQYNIRREDRYQIISYIHLLKAAIGGFITPMPSTSEALESACCYHVGTLRGYGGDIRLFSLKIPSDSGAFQRFCDEIKSEEDRLRRDIQNTCYVE
ncbi:MAG: McrC family protein [Spirochaetaceae bacterium]|jgi:5-methylcytosine-specific restriction endonuclease McrBC regulatory subunit McrC|nr:McrC family protein [Spirochaetaceae bacterium]